MNELRHALERKHILFDTNVLIRALSKPTEAHVFFRLLQEAQTVLVYFPFIKFEFLCGAQSLQLREIREELFSTYGFLELPARSSDAHLVEDAISLSHAYVTHDIKSTSLVDCLIAAYLKRHRSDLLLVTNNLADFPTILFDLIGIYPFNNGKQILPFAFMQYSQSKSFNLGLERSPE